MPGNLEQVAAALVQVAYFEEQAATSYAADREDLVELWSWHQALAGLRKSQRQLTAAFEVEMLRELKGDAVRLDDYIVRGEEEPPMQVLKDPAALADYLGLTAGALVVFRSDALKIDGLRAWATEQGDDPNEIEDRFFDYRGDPGPVRLRLNAMQYAPWWSLDMQPGERRKPPPPKWRQQTAAPETEEATA